jgi:hypothetical protein
MTIEMLYQLMLAAGVVYLVVCTVIVIATLVASTGRRLKNKLLQRRERKCER